MSYGVSITEDGTVLDTAGKYLDQDIVVGMSDSIKLPAQTFNPSTVDQVIPAGKYLSGAQTIKAVSGTKSITANGSGIDVAGFAAVNVNVPQGALNCKRFDFSLPTDHAAYEKLVLVTDSDIATHYADQTFYAALIFKDGFQDKTSTQMMIQGNLLRDSSYGAELRSSATAVGHASSTHSFTETPSSSTVNSMFANANGELGYTISSQYPLRAGDYVLIVWW